MSECANVKNDQELLLRPGVKTCRFSTSGLQSLLKKHCRIFDIITVLWYSLAEVSFKTTVSWQLFYSNKYLPKKFF